MKSTPNSLNLRSFAQFFWALVVLFLPVTSFKYFPFLGKDTMVRPLSFYPLAVLVLILLLQLARREVRLKLNGSLLIYSLFLAIALAASIWGAVMNPITMHGQDYSGRMLRAWVTLAGGLVFFFASMLMNQDEKDLHFTLKFLYLGLAISIIWGAIQMMSYYLQIPDRATLNEFQTSFSVRKLLVKKRAAGFAYEPSWLANQLATIYLPWLIASVLSGYRIFKQRWVEPVVLGGAVGLLVATFSRGGILMALGASVLVVVMTQTHSLKRVLGWWKQSFISTGGWRLHWQARLGRISLTLGLIGCLGAMVLVLSSHPYFSKIWKSNKTTLAEYMVDISAGPRLAYAMAGLGIYEDHPLTGVGLGGAGMYLYDQIPEWAKNLSEIAKHLTPNGTLYPNTKNLYVRLLAETGLFGFGIYTIFQLVVLGQILALLKFPSREVRFISLAGMISWFTLMFFNFTQDSFLDPNGWLNLAIFLSFSSGLPLISTRTGQKKARLINRDMIDHKITLNPQN